MRSPVDLLELPYSFTQLPALTARAFMREAAARGVRLTDAQLEGLHRVRLLTPLFRVRRDGRAVASAARSDRVLAQHLAHWESTSRRDLLRVRDEGRLFAAAEEPFVSRARLVREVNGIEYRSSEYLYSTHQLLLLPLIQSALPFLRYQSDTDVPRVVGLDTNRWWRSMARGRAKAFGPLVVVLSALETLHYPRIVRRLSFPIEEEFAQYDRWLDQQPVEAMLDWLGIDADWLKESAIGLLGQADGFDPLGEWITVVREAAPDRWEKLKGAARSAIDFRIAAEILLRHHDQLARAGRAARIEPPTDRWSGADPLHHRLKPQRGLDGILTDFELSPHPSLLLVVEGATELLLFPRLMQFLGIRTDDDFIAIHDAEGVSKDISALVSYAIAPRIAAELVEDEYLRLLRPLARILVVTDPEGPMRTEERRKRRREAWVDRLYRTLPSQHRTANVKESLDRLVYVETWDERGQSFEFAHFTDRELARAIAAIDARARQPELRWRLAHVARVRKAGGNLGSLLGGGSKLDLAEALWPVLERKVRRAERHGTAERIPIVRVLDRATDLAVELPRRNLVIPR